MADKESPRQRVRVEIDARLPSGNLLAKVDANSSMSGDELKAELATKIEAGSCIQQLLFKSTPLSSSTLAEVGVGVGDPPYVVNVVLGSKPTLHMFEPCSAMEFAQSLVKLNDFGDVSELPVFAEPIRFVEMEKAPVEAQEIAQSLHTALKPEFGKMFPSPFGGFFQGYVVVISGVLPTDDPFPGISVKGTGKGGKKGKEIAARHFGGIDEPLKKTCCEALGGINTAAESFNESGSESGDVNWHLMFVKPIDVADEDTCPFVTECEWEDISDAAKSCAHAGQRVMAAKLARHFVFDFDCDVFKLFPEIYGGFASDGSIVGILRGRVMEA